MPWLQSWDRETVRSDVEEASGRGLSVEDSLPDSLIAIAQNLGLRPYELRMWIYDEPKRGDWSTAALRAWASRFGFGEQPKDEDPKP